MTDQQVQNKEVFFFLNQRKKTSLHLISFQFLLLIDLPGAIVVGRGCSGLQCNQAIGFLLNSSAIPTQPLKVAQYPEYQEHKSYV